MLFFSKEKYIVPHLKLLHRYPEMLPKQVVDVGAVGPLLNGSDVMAPGLLTAVAQLNPVTGAGIFSPGSQRLGGGRVPFREGTRRGDRSDGDEQ